MVWQLSVVLRSQPESAFCAVGEVNGPMFIQICSDQVPCKEVPLSQFLRLQKQITSEQAGSGRGIAGDLDQSWQAFYCCSCSLQEKDIQPAFHTLRYNLTCLSFFHVSHVKPCRAGCSTGTALNNLAVRDHRHAAHGAQTERRFFVPKQCQTHGSPSHGSTSKTSPSGPARALAFALDLRQQLGGRGTESASNR